MSNINFWEDHLFVLITPDTIQRNLVKQIIEKLNENGFEPVYYEMVKATSQDLDKLYAVHIEKKWDSYRYRLIDMLFSLDICLALVVKAQDKTNCYERLKKLKGNNSPCKSPKGTIRRDLRGINSIMGLLHTSDNPYESEWESSIFIKGDIKEISNLSLLLKSMNFGLEKGDYLQVLNRLRMQLLLYILNKAEGKIRDKLTDYLISYKPLYGNEFNQVICSLELKDDELSEFICFNFNEVNKAYEGNLLEKKIVKYDANLDEWERLVLISSMYFEPTVEG
ncbi:nucleoside-diphosphate kinase [Abyssisolibacter fermentans]|uniref:nucleoside-diphosphate kinase n=1 Tax=Abyssisolibacter fermentans TaxID=1766203 RepID=UPI0008376116|nr:nucleoside-diphosphate kinase [Abyssisolibacter fermentans]